MRHMKTSTFSISTSY